MKATTQIQSLKTPDYASGMALSTELARDISLSMATARHTIPRELIASILLVAVSIANEGWSKTEIEQGSLSHAL